MPDQSRAAEEHALLAEISGELQELPPSENLLAGEVDFPVVLRGYDRIAVDAYVRRMSRRLSDLEANRSPDTAVRRALERVGEEVSGILQRAHETADQITAQSRSEAEDRLETARLEAAQITARARERLRELDAETDRIWGERMRILEDVRNLSAELLRLSEESAERFPAADTGETEAVGIQETRPMDAEEIQRELAGHGHPGGQGYAGEGEGPYDGQAPEGEPALEGERALEETEPHGEEGPGRGEEGSTPGEDASGPGEDASGPGDDGGTQATAIMDRPDLQQ